MRRTRGPRAKWRNGRIRPIFPRREVLQRPNYAYCI